jgi:hypothetical protein
MATRPGPRSIYQADEHAWLDPVLKAYLDLEAESASAATLRKFRDDKTEEFLTEFEAQLVAPNLNKEVTAVIEIETSANHGLST